MVICGFPASSTSRLSWRFMTVVDPPTGEMVMLNFLVGLLLGILIGGAICVRYLRREIAANVGPQLRQLNLKIETLESVLNLALLTRHVESTSLALLPARRPRS